MICPSEFRPEEGATLDTIALRTAEIDTDPESRAGDVDRPEPSGEDTVATSLHRLIGAEVVTLIVIETVGSPGRQQQWVGNQAGRETGLSPAGWLDHPVRRHLAQYGSNGLPFRVPGPGQPFLDLLVLPVQSAGQRVICWTLTRSARRFGPQDLSTAELVLPGLRSAVHPAIQALTERELHVLQLIARGLTSTSIARRCGISVRTVHKHLEHIYDKLGCRDRVSAALMLRDAQLSRI